MKIDKEELEWDRHENGEKLTVTVRRESDGKELTLEGDSLVAFVRVIGHYPDKQPWEQPAQTLFLEPRMEEVTDDTGEDNMAYTIVRCLMEFGMLEGALSRLAAEEHITGENKLKEVFTDMVAMTASCAVACGYRPDDNPFLTTAEALVQAGENMKRAWAGVEAAYAKRGGNGDERLN